MTALKPYLIRAIYEWIVDNGMVPLLLVNADYPDVIVPVDFVDNGKIILNIRPEAVQGLILGNDEIQFNARFSGRAMHITVPTKAVLAIYARENGKGMVFDPEDGEDETPPPKPEQPRTPQKPKLRIVK